MKKREKIIIVLGVLGAGALVSAFGFLAYQKFQPDMVMDPNITEEYRQTLEAELADMRQLSLENPQDIDARISIGILEAKLGKLSAAERTFKAALRLDGRDYLAYLHLGIVYEAMGQYEKADGAFRVSTQLEPTDARPFQELITLYKHHFQDKSDELDTIFRAASDYTNSPDIWAEYAQFLEDRSQIRQSWVYWQQVLDAQPDNEKAAANVARLGKQLGASE